MRAFICFGFFLLSLGAVVSEGTAGSSTPDSLTVVYFFVSQAENMSGTLQWGLVSLFAGNTVGIFYFMCRTIMLDFPP